MSFDMMVALRSSEQIGMQWANWKWINIVMTIVLHYNRYDIPTRNSYPQFIYTISYLAVQPYCSFRSRKFWLRPILADLFLCFEQGHTRSETKYEMAPLKDNSMQRGAYNNVRRMNILHLSTLLFWALAVIHLFPLRSWSLLLFLNAYTDFNYPFIYVIVSTREYQYRYEVHGYNWPHNGKCMLWIINSRNLIQEGAFFITFTTALLEEKETWKRIFKHDSLKPVSQLSNPTTTQTVESDNKKPITSWPMPLVKWTFACLFSL